jgi:hypothetical protein
MKLNTVNINNVSGLISRLNLKRPKVVMAVVLVTVMAFMWIKVLAGHRAQKNEARADVACSSAQQTAAQQQDRQVKVALHPLPVVPGRNDVLTQNVFTAGRWKAFPSDGRQSGGASNLEIDRNDAGYIDKIAETITLEAVIKGPRPEAFIHGKLVSVGNKLPVRYNDRIYQFDVIGIQETKVVLKWNDFTVDVKMSQLSESGN